VFVSNSLPVRDVDRFGTQTPNLHVFGNRGASGIDGILSTALGIAYGRRTRVVAIVGDLAFLHDLSALVTRQRLNLPLDIVVLDNNGGGIFEFLPVARHDPPFTELFVTPHGQSIGKIAQALGMQVLELGANEALGQTLGVGSPSDEARLVVVKTDRKENVRHRRELEASLDAALLRAPEASARAR
jgi:2-succinyl-5-enolpyruvyl-6-hydroxy-3-cyclohexene-1-carboxylate synthase